MKLILLLLLIATSSEAQLLARHKVSDSEKKSGIIEKFILNEFEQGQVLSLYKNSRYIYILGSGNHEAISSGSWSKKGNKLILKSTLIPTDVPIKVIYRTDTSLFGGSFKFGIIKNKRGDEIVNSFVYVNDSSSQCAPISGTCTSPVNKIDSIRVRFANGTISRWKRISGNPVRIDIEVQMDIDPNKYYPKPVIRFEIKGNKIKGI